MRLGFPIAAAGIALLSGCASPWSEHYRGARLNALPQGAPVKLVASRSAEVENAQVPGFALLGRASFGQDVDAGEGSLEEFARSIGAPLVYFSIEDKGERTKRVRKAEYLPSGSTTGNHVDADGVVRPIDGTTNSYMFVEVEREVTERVWEHAAAFFAPAESTGK